MMRIRLSSLAACVASVTVATIVVAVGESYAFRMVPMNLAEMSAAAERIVVGVCTAREAGERQVSPGGPSVRFTQYTFQISDTLKGDVGPTLTIKQVRLGRRSASPGPEQPFERDPLQLPDYQAGQEVLVFLGGDSSLGLTSPVAMEQAVFDVEMRNGQKIFKHRFKNHLLFRDMPIGRFAASRQLSADEASLFPITEDEPIPYAPFVSLVRKLVNGN